MVGNVEESRLGKAETLETGEARARCFAAKSRRRLAQMLLIQVTEVKGSLGRSSTFVHHEPKTLPLHSGEAKRVTPVGLTSPSSTTAVEAPARRTKTS